MIGRGQLDQGLAHIDADHVRRPADEKDQAGQPDDARQAEGDGADPEHRDRREHPHAPVPDDRIAAQIDGHDHGPHPERRTQQTEPLRPHMQDVAREDGRQQGHARQQHHHQIQRYGAQHDLGLPHIGEPLLDRIHRRQWVGLGRGLAAGADQDEGGDGQEEHPQRHRIGQGHIDAHDHPAQGRAGDSPGLEGDGLGRDGGRQGLATHHHRQEGLAGRGQKGARCAEQGRDRQQPPQRRRAVKRHGQERRRAGRLDQDGDPHGPLPVAPIRHRPGRQGEGQQRQELTQADQPQIQAGLFDRMIAPRDLIDLPQQGRGLDLDGQNRHDPPEPQQAEVAYPPRAGRPLGRRRRNGQGGGAGVDGFCGHVRLGDFG